MAPSSDLVISSVNRESKDATCCFDKDFRQVPIPGYRNGRFDEPNDEVCDGECDGECDALARIVARWHSLPEHVRQTLRTIVDSCEAAALPEPTADG